MNINKTVGEKTITFSLYDPVDADEQALINGLKNACLYYKSEPDSTAPCDQFYPGVVYQQLEYGKDGEINLIMLKE